MARPWYARRWLVTLVSAGAAVWLANAVGTGSPRPPRPVPRRTAECARRRGTGLPHRAPDRARGPGSAGVAQPAPLGRCPPGHAGRRGTPGTALALLATLPVKGRAPRTGYDREQFGQAWLDTDRNGCDTRNDILRRDLTGVRLRPGTAGCLVESGTLDDPYTGTAIHYVRGNDTVDIDHVVALSNAWQTGASGWDVRKRAALANDPMNLLAVDMSANRQKGDGDAATWLPSNKPFRCAYVARQVSVKAKYHLWLTAPERDASARILRGCPGQRAWFGGAPVLSPVGVNVPPRATPAPVRDGSSGVSYANCDAVRAAGAAPIHRGDPGYAPHLDRDGDGVGCE